MKKRGRQTGKERFTLHASLCGGGDLLKALGSVASYLADRLFNLSNDSKSWLLHCWEALHSLFRIGSGREDSRDAALLTMCCGFLSRKGT
jgi:hypothetical protein